MPHVTLAGDSIFDNGAYTQGGPDVISQVRQLLPPDWQATLVAADGATTNDVAAQIARIPKTATHLVLSVGGNDALMQMNILEAPVSSMTAALGLLADTASAFEASYHAAVTACVRTGLAVAVCTIYNGSFEDRTFQRLASTALTVFNDVILRAAITQRLPVIDLRSVCARAEDYANPIEPSSAGGEKIARAIVALVCGSNDDGTTRIVAGDYTTP